MPSAMESSPWSMSRARRMVDSARLLLVFFSFMRSRRPLTMATRASQLLIKGVDVVEAVVPTDGGLDGGHGVDQRLRLLAADDGAHESPGIDRRIVGTAADQRLEVIEQLARGSARMIQRRDLRHGADAVFTVNDFISNRKHPIFPQSYYLWNYHTTKRGKLPVGIYKNFLKNRPAMRLHGVFPQMTIAISGVFCYTLCIENKGVSGCGCICPDTITNTRSSRCC